MLAKIPAVGPRPSSSAEPTTGPKRIPRLRNVALSRTALGSSAEPTKSCSMSCSPGPHSDPAIPCRTSRTQASQTCRESVRNSTPHAAETVMNSSWAAWMTRRQSYRSASAPNDTDSSRNGTQWLITWNPAKAGEWNFSHSTQYVITCSTLSAIIARAAPKRYGRQSLLRSAANLRGLSSTTTWVGTPQAAHMASSLTALGKNSEAAGPKVIRTTAAGRVCATVDSEAGDQPGAVPQL